MQLSEVLAFAIRTIRHVGVQLAVLLASMLLSAVAQASNDYKLADGDAIHIVVFQNPDLTLDTRVSESGTIAYPLIGQVKIGGLTIAEAEARIASSLESGGFVKKPQVNINLTQIVGNQVSVLGQVNKPGSYPLLTFNTHVSQMLATAGGIASTGGDSVILMGTRDGKPFRKVIDVASLYLDNNVGDDLLLEAGDGLYVDRAPMFYIYGEVQRPGNYPIARHMTVVQALAAGGGLTPRGTERSLRVYRHRKDGTTERIEPKSADLVQPDDVIYVGESLF
jgi:polysaccharide export outer membrane protein